MRSSRKNKILSTIGAEHFIGRSGEMDRLMQHVGRGSSSSGLLIGAAPGAGASELLRQAYDRLFFGEPGPIPFYFEFETGETAGAAARRFVHEFILQVVAFRRRHASVIASSAGLAELSELALPADAHWIDRLIELLRPEADFFDDGALIRSCFSAPIRAAAEGVELFVIIDGVHNASGDLLTELRAILRPSELSYVLSGRRRSVADIRELPLLPLDNLMMQEAGRLVEDLAGRSGLEINDECRDLIALQLGGNPKLIGNFFYTAVAEGGSVESFDRVQQIYAESLFHGSIRYMHDAELAYAAQTPELARAVTGLLFDTAFAGDLVPAESWRSAMNVGERSFYKILNALDTAEMISYSSAGIEVPKSTVLTDHINARFRVDIVGENETLVFARSLAEYIRRAPEMMARSYRESAALGIGDLLRSFRSQTVPLPLIDYGKFENEYKGAPDGEVLSDLKNSTDTIVLPNVFFVADAIDLYRPIEVVTEKRRSAIALGFEDAGETPDLELAWIAAEVDSKLEVTKELAEFWCDRLEMAAVMCDFLNYRLWLVSPEGFSPDALSLLGQRNAYGSSRKQFELLRRLIGERPSASSARVYEIVLPMGEDTELIAARAAEDIAKRHNFDPRSINQIKTALVEACINASEHSLSPDGKIYQKFTVEDDRIVITVSNRGLRLTGRTAAEPRSDEARRGWGLTLMRRLMDEVTVENVDDGTRISMTKYLKPAV